jgi:hypothetical protein
MNGNIPLVMGPKGPVPTSPTTIRETILSQAVQESPGLTADLPGIMIEDILSTDTPAISQIDQYRVDAVNSLTPYGANEFTLNQQGAMLGIAKGKMTNTSVLVVFSGDVGYVVQKGTIVSDGAYQYVIQDGGTIGSSGSSEQLFAVASQAGSWAVPANTVNQIITSIPSPLIITCTNPIAGIPGQADGESVQSYRARVLEATPATAQGIPTLLKALLKNIPGVTSRLVSIPQVTGGWKVICGGGDSYQVAGAIYRGTLDLSSIKGSSNPARNVTDSIIDPPDTYEVTYVNPPEQVVTVAATWNTTLPNFTAGLQVNALAAPAIQNYINSIVVGQPINLLSMTAAFQKAVASVLEAQYLTTLDFEVTIDSVVTPPEAGTSIILSDSESYFSCASNAVTVVQGS